jgi:hypothetical protein
VLRHRSSSTLLFERCGFSMQLQAAGLKSEPCATKNTLRPGIIPDFDGTPEVRVVAPTGQATFLVVAEKCVEQDGRSIMVFFDGL